MTFSIIIVSWNVREKLRQNLTALRAGLPDQAGEIWVVDNASADGTAEMVAADFPAVRLIANKENRGFAAASNQALRQARGECCVLLNPDMRVDVSVWADLRRWLAEHPEAAVTGIRLRDEKGLLIRHVRRFPRLTDQAAIILKLPHLFPHLLDRYICSDFDYDAAAPVDSIRGAFFAIRRSTLETVGLLDERYFLWFEEVDYCRQVRAAGQEVWYTPAAEAIDYIGQSFTQVPRAAKQRYFRDSMIAYFKKWHPRWQARTISIIWLPGRLIAAVGDIFRLASRTKT